MAPLPVILIFDVGKTNKKTLLFDEKYKLVWEESIKLEEVTDEDGFPCEDIVALTEWMVSSFKNLLTRPDFQIKAVNFSAYGASLVYIDANGKPVLPLYNYLKPYPPDLLEKFYYDYGGKEVFAKKTASPVLGSLNSGMQLYRIKNERPEVFTKIKYALHLPQYLSYVISGVACSEITSVGCHTNLWDFTSHGYHEWVSKEGAATKLPTLHESTTCFPMERNGQTILVGTGLHDSSAALIPYATGFNEPFILLSTGTWCISLNPFNHLPLSNEELKKDCLCYLTHAGKPVKASRLFTGFEHEVQTKRLADQFGKSVDHFNALEYNPANLKRARQQGNQPVKFSDCDLRQFENAEDGYYALILDLVGRQRTATELVWGETPVKRIFVDGGFSKNKIYMHMMAVFFPEREVYAASIPQASALGAAQAIHAHWNPLSLPSDSITLTYYANQP